MKRALALCAGLALAAGALYALLTATAPPPAEDPGAEIDEASRKRLEAVLREADQDP